MVGGMTEIDKPEQDAASPPKSTVTPWHGVERRRPGRQASVSPELIPLLRGTPEIDPLHDDSSPIRGIVASVAISAVLLAVMGFAARSLIKYYQR